MKKGKRIISPFTGMTATLMAVLLLSSPAPSVAAEGARAHFDSLGSVTVTDLEIKAEAHENAAREMQAKAQEQKQLLEQYKAKSYLYGRQAQDLQGQAHAMAHKYGKAAKSHTREAALYREKATRLRKMTPATFRISRYVAEAAQPPSGRLPLRS